MDISVVLIMSVLIEAVITYVKQWFVEKRVKWQCVAAAVLSIAVCLVYSIDIPAMVGIVSPVKYVGSILTGVLVSRGSNYINDLLKMLISKKEVAE